jgi:hypothetical protein
VGSKWLWSGCIQKNCSILLNCLKKITNSDLEIEVEYQMNDILGIWFRF